ncbi:hypothetical protein [Terrabacter sp. C0L_2]|uniref:hypothetical protein n=1 Tax=Terrabacter sp. C0L_2 TaxID=3108389 RepID=UPI003FCC5D7F
MPWLSQPLLTLLAQADPVSLENLAAATGRSISDVRHGLTAMAGTEYDADGRILGQGLVPPPTR